MSTVSAVAPPKLGIRKGLTYDEYVEIPAVRHSDLKPFERTPAHARESILRGDKETKAKASGHAFHVLTLEPDLFWLQYGVPPKCDRRTTAGKQAWADWTTAHPNVIAIAPEEMVVFEKMRDSVMAHPTARELLSGKGHNELVAVWEERDDETGELQPCKLRVDRLGAIARYSTIGDLKTTTNAEERAFSKDAAKYGYFSAMAWYRRGLQAVAPIAAPRKCVFVAVEKDPPYCVAVHEVDERALEQGERQVLGWLKTYQQCMRTGSWPGYGDGCSTIDYPPWAVDQLD